MMNRQRQILFTILGGIVMLLAGGISTSYAQASNTPDFAGEWDTVTSTGKTFVLTLKTTNRRSAVTGSYYEKALARSYKPLGSSASEFVKVSALMAEPVLQTLYPNEISGTVTDNVLRFTWAERTSGDRTKPVALDPNAARGSGRFTISSDGESFEGTFSRSSDPDDTSGGTWNGTRRHSFAGAWQGKMGGATPFTLVLQQDDVPVTGYRVTGQLLSNAELTIRDGKIVGNTLRFGVWRLYSTLPIGSKPKEEYLGSGELVMERGGKSFTGTILGAAASGTLVGRPGRR